MKHITITFKFSAPIRGSLCSASILESLPATAASATSAAAAATAAIRTGEFQKNFRSNLLSARPTTIRASAPTSSVWHRLFEHIPKAEYLPAVNDHQNRLW